MMIGVRNHPSMSVHVPPWSFTDNPTAAISLSITPNGNFNFNGDDYSFFLQNDSPKDIPTYLPSNDVDADSDGDGSGRESDILLEVYSCDHFRMFDFKVRKCARGRSHDWTECPYAHPGEKARRRDPRKFHYSGTACSDFRKGNCKKGDFCEFAHGVFECWLHPARYRTQPCKDGPNCPRRVCFFAHTPEQLRVLSPMSPGSGESYDGSPRRLKGSSFMSSLESGSSASESPPVSPMANSLSRSLGSNSVSEMVASLRQLQLTKVKSMPTSWGLQMGSSGFGSPRLSMTRPGFCSLPSTPTRAVIRPRRGYMDLWDEVGCEEEPLMERVESGRDLRAKMFEKLSKENPLGRVDPNPSVASNPDVGWVSELLK